MKKQLNIQLAPPQAADQEFYTREIAKRLDIEVAEISSIRIRKKSIDARSRNIKINLNVEVFIDEEEAIPTYKSSFEYKDVKNAPEVIIVGAGPAGLFAALRLIELGLKPIILERGKAVNERKRDIAAIHRNEKVNPDSNYGFGEGGAGTFSDGKLYTRSKKRGDVTKILEVLHQHGAQDEILYDAHPHIGTNVLPRVITKIRETILYYGGEVLFNQRIVDFVVESETMKGVVTQDGTQYKGQAVILATGHSARDIYYLLRNNGIHLEAKNFAVGVRLEHPQELIDSIQYKRPHRGKYLPAAAYSFAEQVDGRGVYSFCMCPGGVIVPAATGSKELVVNGMSPSSRGGKFANAGLVVEVRTDDLKQYTRHRELAGLKFQEEIERKCFKMANNSQIAPAQRMLDFVQRKNSASLNDTSYHPAIESSDMHRWMPDFISNRLAEGFKKMGRKAKRFLSNDATIIGIESRTSSPIRIPRDLETLQHVKIKNLYPCGEGAGYAGGIVSSAVDGERCAEKVAELIW